MKDLTRAQKDLDKRLWWTTVRPWLATMPATWPSQHRGATMTEDEQDEPA